MIQKENDDGITKRTQNYARPLQLRISCQESKFVRPFIRECNM